MSVNLSQKNRHPSTGFDSGTLLNLYTIILVGCLIPMDPFTSNLSLTIATYGFVIMASINHIIPQRFDFTTHLVKASYTWLLFITIKSYFFIPMLVSCVDLLPLAIRASKNWQKQLKTSLEAIGAIARIVAIIIGFYQVQFNEFLVLFYFICNAIYYRERQHRIKNNKRHAYGWSHFFEHLAILSFLFVVNYNRLDLNLVYITASFFTLSICLSMLIIGVSINQQLYKKNRESLPEWFDPSLLPSFEKKIRGNAHSKKLHNYILKPFTPMIRLIAIDWNNIDHMISQINIKEPFDVIVGIMSGGGFLSGCIARKYHSKKIAYVLSKNWSQLSLFQNIKRALKYYLGKPYTPEIRVFGEPSIFKNKTVLLVDDSVCTGMTITAATSYLKDLGATRVITWALFCNEQCKTDYYYSICKTPLIWPWGWEAD